MLTFLYGVAGFFAALAAAMLSAFVSRVLSARGTSLAAVSMMRQLLNVLVLTAAYFVADALEISIVAVLVGAALGLTVPLIYLTFRSIRGGKKEERKDG